MKVSRESLLFLSYSFTFLLLTFLISTKALSTFTLSNYRLPFSHIEITNLTKSFEQGSLEKKITTHDDPGFILFYSIAQLIKGDSTVDPKGTPETFPVALKIFYVFFHLLIIYFLAHAAAEAITFGTKVVALIFLLSPVFLSVFLGYDVYVFPLYASVLSIYSFGLLAGEKLKPLKLTLLSALVGVCEIFRIYSLFLFLPFAGIAVLKRKMILLSVFLVAYFAVVSSMGLVFSKKGHTAWHNLHAGLFEYGGCINQKGDALPYVIFSIEEAKARGANLCVDHWSDSTQYKISFLHGEKALYSPKYDQILKTQYLDFIKNYPMEMVGLVMVRLFNALSFLPIKETFATGHYVGLTFFSLLGGIIFLVILFLWFFYETDRNRKLFYTATLILALPSPLLVHSQHIIYNIPLHFIQVIILMEFFTRSFPKKLRV